MINNLKQLMSISDKIEMGVDSQSNDNIVFCVHDNLQNNLLRKQGIKTNTLRWLMSDSKTFILTSGIVSHFIKNNVELCRMINTNKVSDKLTLSINRKYGVVVIELTKLNGEVDKHYVLKSYDATFIRKMKFLTRNVEYINSINSSRLKDFRKIDVVMNKIMKGE